MLIHGTLITLVRSKGSKRRSDVAVGSTDDPPTIGQSFCIIRSSDGLGVSTSTVEWTDKYNGVLKFGTKGGGTYLWEVT